MLSINTNTSSLIAQNSMKSSTNKLNQAIERMTTGAKINHAKDNAANYSIATNMTTKINAYQVAEDNCAMGLDMMTTAMESLDLVSNHLSRIRDLAVQASNGTYSGKSLNAIQSEISTRLAESARIIEDSSFNGISLFQASNKSNSKFIKEVVQLSEQEAIAQGYTVIKTADELQAMQDNLSGKYILMNDIDLDGYDWTAIGNVNNRFVGEFNGNGYVISNLYINKNKDAQGLFGAAGYDSNNRASFKNVGLENVNITTNGWSVGALVGYCNGEVTSFLNCIDNCYVDKGTISGGGHTGGLIAFTYCNYGITNCYSTVNVTGKENVGGLVGFASHIEELTNCYSTGNVKGNLRVGGLIGNGVWLTGGMENCYTKSKVSGNTATGAIIGRIQGSIGKFKGKNYYDKLINPDLPAVGEIVDSTDTSLLIEKLPPNPNIISFQVWNNSDNYSSLEFNLEFTLNLSIEITDSNSALDAIKQIDELLAKIEQRQTEFGSAYNRLESALESIIVSYDNLVSSRSTIQDADIAEVSSEYIKMQILQQASATLMATANQSPAVALQLL